MDYLITYLNSLLELIKDLWLWFFLGLVIAAAIQEFIPTDKLLKHFRGNKVKNILKATFAGLFISVCSCGAIPIVAMLRRRGASTATALTMLLATPWAGFLHLLILSSFVGWGNTFILFGCSLIIAFVSGLFLARLEDSKWLEQKIPHHHLEGEKHECLDCLKKRESGIRKNGFWRRVFVKVPKGMWHVFTDVGKFIVIGVLLAAILKAFIPSGWILKFLGSEGGNFIPVLITVPLATIVELCSEGFTVIAGQLYEMGASLGVVLAITIVGVSTDITELSMIWGKFGKKSVIAYVTISILLTVLMAFLLNVLI
jgi:uncharacterized membrane protein YraQ (UPF0718 family)